ncbi:hypothetical protein IAT40_004601 [Kwoniella sp. CBS 6097]
MPASRTGTKKKPKATQLPHQPTQTATASSSHPEKLAPPSSQPTDAPTTESSHPAFPNEIFEQIVQYLSDNHSTLYAWWLVSKTFNQIGFPILSRHLRLSPWMADKGKRKNVPDPKKANLGQLPIEARAVNFYRNRRRIPTP